MLLNKPEHENATTNWSLRVAKRSMAVAACLAFLAGCESFPEMPSYEDMKAGLSDTYDSTMASIDKAWNDESASASAEASDTPVNLDRWGVKRLQSRLATLGYQPGPADGVMGRKTTRAIKKYQSAHGLQPNGRVTAQLLKDLDVSYETGRAGTTLTDSPY